MLKNRINSLRYAFKGIARLMRTQPNARIHLFATIVVVSAGFCFDISSAEWCCCALSIAAVFAAEAFNTAIEDLTDLVSPEYHPLAGHAKDVAAAAVLLMAIGAAAVGAILFLPKILDLFR